MRLSDYTYKLPDCLIADKPADIRGTSRLLILNRQSGSVTDDRYYNVADYFDEGDVIVLNNTRVLKARLKTFKQNGAEREIVVLEKHSFDNDWYHHPIKFDKNEDHFISSGKYVYDINQNDAISYYQYAAFFNQENQVITLDDQYLNLTHNFSVCNYQENSIVSTFNEASIPYYTGVSTSNNGEYFVGYY